jgi:WD40 repeat protein
MTRVSTDKKSVYIPNILYSIRGKIPNLKIVMKKILSLTVCVSFLLVNSLQAKNTPAVIVLKSEKWENGTHDNGACAVAFSPDGTKIVTGRGITARIWDAESGTKTIFTLKNLAFLNNEKTGCTDNCTA